jgi:G3E family GTPase
VTVVDALGMKDECGSGLNLKRSDIDEEDIENLVIQQIEFCNIILLNKAAEVSADELGRIRGIIREIQPKAEIIDCNYGDVELDKIINTQMFDFDEVATSAAWIQEVERHEEDEDDDDDDEHEHEHEHEHHEHEHHHHHHHHHDEGEAEEYGIGTYVYYARRPFHIGLFDEFVARKWPKGIIRAKGICWFKDEPEICYVFEQAGRQVSLRNAGQWYATMPKDELQQLMEQQPSLRRDWDDQYGDRMQKLVFIGQHLDKELIARELDFCLV